MSKASRSQRPQISIVGPGNLGTALALGLKAVGYRVKFLVTRNPRGARTRDLSRKSAARIVPIAAEPLTTEVVWITVPDDAIAKAAHVLARSQEWNGKTVFHSSGALTSDELAPLREKGARVASVHPMMTFVRGKAPDMTGVAFAMEGDAAAMRMARGIVQNLGGTAFEIKKQNKVLYHVFGSFASPLVTVLMASLEQVAGAAGIPQREIKRVVEPLLRQTLSNYLAQDAASAFSGPLVRGDVATVRKHLAELQQLPDARAVYIALAHAALNLLPVKNRASLSRELKAARS